VKYSLAGNIFFISMLVVTLSLKAMVQDTGKTRDHLTLRDSVTAFLTRHQFETHGTQKAISIEPISAISGDCRLLISEMIPQGWNRDSLNTSSTEGLLFFVFKGAVYTEPPAGIESPALSHYWTRLKQKMGLEASSTPILAVITSGNCSLDALPWTEIAEL
jgi:hypothetical protein